jgi:3-hydroxyisobutyrate dehydrogenase-like beta-hydroxyacid dehydrogenase
MKVAVVGLGIAGLSICARLAVAGHQVSGFEQFDPMHTRGCEKIRLNPMTW